MSKIIEPSSPIFLLTQDEFDVCKKAMMFTDSDIDNGIVQIVKPKSEAQVLLEARLTKSGMLKYPTCS